jgi:hypothetical protein
MRCCGSGKNGVSCPPAHDSRDEAAPVAEDAARSIFIVSLRPRNDFLGAIPGAGNQALTSNHSRGTRGTDSGGQPQFDLAIKAADFGQH